MADNVTWQHPDYADAISDWQLMDDVTKGEKAVKAANVKYLPKPNPADTSTENDERYKQYLLRAVFFPATGRTQKGLTSLVFKKEPVVKVPTGLEYVNEDVDGSNNSLIKQAQKVLSKQLGHGRHGLLTDFPDVKEGPVSKAVKDALKLRPTIISIKATQIINWRTVQIGGAHVLALVVIKEASEETGDFETKKVEQYRELVLIEGVYTVRLWRKSEKDEKQWVIYNSYQPKDGAGKTWDRIPFQFVGAENNDPEVDDAPLLDLARINIAHYRNSADYEDSVFFTGQVQPWMTNIDQSHLELMREEGVYIGSRNLLPVPDGGQFGFEQAQPNPMVKEAMDSKEKQMVSLGAHLVEKGFAVKTATQQDSEDAVSHSVVSLCAANLGEAYEQCLRWMAKFENINETGDIVVTLNQDFMNSRLDPQMIMAMVDAWQKQLIAKSDARDYLRRNNGIDAERTDEMIDDELEEEPGLPLDAGPSSNGLADPNGSQVFQA